MKFESENNHTQERLFRIRLDQIIDQRHELVRLSDKIDWSVLDEAWGPLYSFGQGAAIPTRLAAGLHYLKQVYSLSYEELLERWRENPYWQYFCGEEYFQHNHPCHSRCLAFSNTEELCAMLEY